MIISSAQEAPPLLVCRRHPVFLLIKDQDQSSTPDVHPLRTSALGLSIDKAE